jgi:regulator of sigma E protease
MTFLYFVLMISGLIFFHELGHYTFARLSKVHVVTFSIGFGPTLLRWNRKGTVYQLAAIPLGGYVKLLGDDPHEEVPSELKDSAFLNKSLWHRFWIILGGPLFNLVLPFILFFGIGLGTSQHAPSLVGAVSPDSPAAHAGLMPGDRITEIDGSEVHYWWQLQEMISARPGQEMPIAYDRAGVRTESQIKPATVQRSLAPELGLINKVGRIGISHTYPLPIIAVMPGSPAASSGFENGDCIRTVDGQEVQRWEDALKALSARSGTDFQISVERNAPEDYRCTPDELGGAKKLENISFSAADGPTKGLISGEFMIGTVDVKSKYLTEEMNPPPAKRWGLEEGDIILSVDGRRCAVDGGVEDSTNTREPGFASWGEMLGYMHEYVDNLFTVVALRRGPFGSEQVLYWEGVQLVKGRGKSEMNTDIQPVVFGAKPVTLHQRAYPDMIPNDHRFSYGVHLMMTESVEMIHLTSAAIFGLFTGDVSYKNLGGPIMVANLAGASRKHGWASFFRIMALLSISLGLFNLLPIPVLDGGHLLFIMIEAIQRKPISLRVRQTATFIGLAFIMLLIILVFKNDLERNWSAIMSFFGG